MITILVDQNQNDIHVYILYKNILAFNLTYVDSFR